MKFISHVQQNITFSRCHQPTRGAQFNSVQRFFSTSFFIVEFFIAEFLLVEMFPVLQGFFSGFSGFSPFLKSTHLGP